MKNFNEDEYSSIINNSIYFIEANWKKQFINYCNSNGNIYNEFFKYDKPKSYNDDFLSFIKTIVSINLSVSSNKKIDLDGTKQIYELVIKKIINVNVYLLNNELYFYLANKKFIGPKHMNFFKTFLEYSPVNV